MIKLKFILIITTCSFNLFSNENTPAIKVQNSLSKCKKTNNIKEFEDLIHWDSIYFKYKNDLNLNGINSAVMLKKKAFDIYNYPEKNPKLIDSVVLIIEKELLKNSQNIIPDSLKFVPSIYKIKLLKSYFNPQYQKFCNTNWNLKLIKNSNQYQTVVLESGNKKKYIDFKLVNKNWFIADNLYLR